MTNLIREPHHKICGCRCLVSKDKAAADRRRVGHSEGGYTLVALLAMMTVLALFAMAAAPRIQQQAQRDREKEAIFRGEEVADAIRAYYLNRLATLRVQGDQALPTSMDQLLEGIPIRGAAKNRQILRVSAARDPLTADGEWRFVHPRSEALANFQRSILEYSGTIVPVPQNRQIAQLQQFAAPQLTTVLNIGLSEKPSNATSAADDSSGPFVGISTRNPNKSVLTYYGIDRLDQWVFTPLFRN